MAGSVAALNKRAHIDDLILRQKINEVPEIVSSVFRESISGKRVLDFGSGFGYTAWALAMYYSPTYVAGVDIFPEYIAGREVIRTQTGLDWPSNLRLRQIRPGEKIGETGFDLIYSWSVFEHVDLEILDDVIQDLFVALNAGGSIMIQIDPLYHSRQGAHLWEAGLVDHEHLIMPTGRLHKYLLSGEKVSPKRGADLWDMFSMLNRITPETLKRYFVKHGFEIQSFLEFKSEGLINPILLETYPESVLRTEQVVAVFRKPR